MADKENKITPQNIAYLLWIILGILIIAVIYDYNSQAYLAYRDYQNIAHNNRIVNQGLKSFEHTRTLLGNAKSHILASEDQKQLDRLGRLEMAYEETEFFKERVLAFESERINNSKFLDAQYPLATNLYIPIKQTRLVRDTLTTLQQKIPYFCKGCENISNQYSEDECNLWNMTEASQLIWKTAFLNLHAKANLVQSEVLLRQFNPKEIKDFSTDFPIELGKMWIKPQFSIIEEGLSYEADVFFGIPIPTLRNYPAYNADLYKLRLQADGSAQIAFNTWANTFDDRDEFHKTWELYIYLQRGYLLLENRLPFQDTTLNAQGDYLLLRELFDDFPED
ncbi:MAG: hypothetical protein JJT94_06660 [Bernardetiaceae bacterium]|nr:hypothetical protein [Bernardetiaceae bacterium]